MKNVSYLRHTDDRYHIIIIIITIIIIVHFIIIYVQAKEPQGHLQVAQEHSENTKNTSDKQNHV
jgi:hypothetical protein